MDQEHPIPQQISTYEFRLVGDMTIKQFFQVAAGALIAIVFYATSLPPYIKWPFVVVSFLTGIAFAFFPLEDRPLPKWIYLFVKAIYSPTVFFWKKTKREAVFLPEPDGVQQDKSDEAQDAASDDLAENEIEESEETQNLEKKELEILNKVEEHFDQTQRVELPQPLEIDLNKVETEELPKKAGEERQDVKVVEQQPINVDKSQKIYQAEPVFEPSKTGSQLTPLAGEEIHGLQQAQFSDDAAPPNPPTQTNVIVGQVIDDGGKILENVILEIKDAEGRPVRALKTNKLGHFMIVTPLPDGKYEIITEAQGYLFDPVEIMMSGEIVPPIAIRAKAKAQ